MAEEKNIEVMENDAAINLDELSDEACAKLDSLTEQFTASDMKDAAVKMTDEELDHVAGGYSYGAMTIEQGRGRVTFKMLNQNTGKIERHSGRTQQEAMANLVKYNFQHRQKTIVLNEPNGKRHVFNVDEIAKELGFKR